jgi:hypothetical protein
MLAVRRQTVTMVCGALATAGLIGGRRGVIQVRNRTGLEESSCECYAASRRHYERLFT